VKDGQQQVDERCGEMAGAFARLESELERLQSGLKEAQRRRASGEKESAELVSRLEQELAGAKALFEQHRAEAEQAGADAARRLEEEQRAGAAREAALHFDFEERLEYVDNFARTQREELAAQLAARDEELKSEAFNAAERLQEAQRDASRAAELHLAALNQERMEAAAVISALEGGLSALVEALDRLRASCALSASRHAAAAADLQSALERVRTESREAAKDRDAALAAAERAAVEAEERRGELLAAAERAEAAADGRIGELLDEVADLQTATARAETHAAAETKRAAAAEAALRTAEAGRLAAEEAGKAAEEKRAAAAAAAAAAEKAADARIGELLAEVDEMQRSLRRSEERRRELEAHANEIMENNRRGGARGFRRVRLAVGCHTAGVRPPERGMPGPLPDGWRRRPGRREQGTSDSTDCGAAGYPPSRARGARQGGAALPT
jgi:hypothetical protein